MCYRNKQSKSFSFLTIGLFVSIILWSLNLIQAQPEMQRTQAVNHQSGVVTGSIVDANGVPLQYASVNVKRASDSVTVQYGVTDSEGKFTLEGIPFGKYIVEIQYIGYQKSVSAPFVISKENAVYKIAKYKMTNKNTDLGEVVIKAQKDMLQTNLDKTVFNIESSINATGQTAVEVLEEIPSVSVDVEGNVSLRGSENVTILVDGRATNLTLDQIPADLIESIEVITNPSARLEPDGMAGILNVVLKKKKESGFNGMATLGASSSCLYHNDKHNIFLSGYNGNISFNYRYDKINLFVSYGYRNHSHRNAGTMWRESWFGLGDDRELSRMEQDNYGGSKNQFHNASLAFDYYINKYNTITFNLGGHFGRMNWTRDLWSNTRNLALDDTSLFYHQVGDNLRRFNNVDASINYKKTFLTPGMELTADLFFTQRNGNADDEYLQSHFEGLDDFYQTTNTIELNRDASAQVDFVTPVGNGGRIETGYKFSYRGVGQDYSLFSGISESTAEEDLSQRNNFEYTELLNALYFIYSNTFWKKLQLQLGVRGEVSYTISDLKSADMVFSYWNYCSENDDFGKVFCKNFFYPTVHLKYEINPEHALQFSFSRRVQRPRIHQLNPFVDYSDKENLMCGNPTLKPEFANSFELGYMFNHKQTSLTLTAFYRRRTDLVTRYTEILYDPLEERTYTMTSYENLNKSQNFGLEFFFGQRVKKIWKVNVTGSFYRNIIDSDNLLDENLSRDWAWNAGVNQTFTVGKDFDIQLNFRYRSASLTAGSMGWGMHGVGQGRRSANYRLNLGLKKGFLDNSLVVSLNIRNMLYFIPKVRQMQIASWQNCAVYDELYEPNVDATSGYYSYSIRENEGFNISLNLTYKLNNYRNRPAKISSEDEYEGMGE